MEGQAERGNVGAFDRQNLPVAASVQFSTNKLAAYILLKPDSGGRPLSIDYLLQVLRRYEITTGVDRNALESLLANPVYNSPVLVARGKESVQGKDAEIKFLFELHRDLTPKVKEDGTVDFKDFGAIQTVTKGTPLVEKTPRTDGEKGVNVCGQVVEPKPARDLPIPAGRNVILTPDKLKLVAAIDGQAVFHNDRVSVLNTYVVEGDVGVATGNIDFNGNVLIKGLVNSGFKVNAAGDIEVLGIVEAAELIAGGNILLRSGFNGAEKGLLKAEGSITARFIQGGNVQLGGKLETTYIYNSTIRSRDCINVTGKGIVLGGHIAARARIDAGTLGNDSYTKTIVEVGTDPETVKRNTALIAEIDAASKNMKAIEDAINILVQLKEAGKLPPEKEEHIEKSKVMLERLAAGMEALKAEKIAIDEKISQLGKGFVAVRNVAYPGVVIVMSTEQMPLKGKYFKTLFSRTEGYIRSGPL